MARVYHSLSRERGNRMNHDEHVANGEWHKDCADCLRDADAIDWLMAVRKYGLEIANAMFADRD